MNYRILFSLFIPYLAIITLGAVYFYHQEKNYELNFAVNQSQNNLHSSAQIFEREIAHAIDDLLFLANSSCLERALLNNSEDAMSSLQRTLQHLAHQKLSYHQMRFIDASGYERVRVDTDEHESKVMDSAELQDKSHRYYFQKAIELEKGEIYFSAFDLNIENKEIEIPYRPMLRIATPVKFAGQDETQGIAIINYNGQSAIDIWLKQIAENHHDNLALLNNDGYWVYGGGENNWAFMFGKKASFAHQYPDIWQKIQSQNSGVIETEQGTFIFENIFFNAKDKDINTPHKLISVYQLDAAELNEIMSRFTPRLLMVYGLLSVVGFLLSLFITHLLLKREDNKIRDKELEFAQLLTKSQ